MTLPRLAYVLSLLSIGAGAAWIWKPLGLLVVGGLVWWDLHQVERRR